MLAFRERLLLIGEDDPAGLYGGIIGAEIFATAGSEPVGKKSLTVEQWVTFMLE
ncbi:MAG: hypothetical protein GY852_02490 [bacterium]|nr:hypothetical protein [bacterium]